MLEYNTNFYGNKCGFLRKSKTTLYMLQVSMKSQDKFAIVQWKLTNSYCIFRRFSNYFAEGELACRSIYKQIHIFIYLIWGYTSSRVEILIIPYFFHFLTFSFVANFFILCTDFVAVRAVSPYR